MICTHCEREIESGIMRYEDSIEGTQVVRVMAIDYERYIGGGYEFIIDPEPYCEECHNEIMGYNRRRA